MALITRCCCWHSVRSGSFAAGFYTLMLYIIIMTGTAFDIYSIFDTHHAFIVNLVMLVFYMLCIISSVVLLIGLCAERKNLLIPWLLSVTITTVVDVVMCTLHSLEKTFNAFYGTLITIDAIIWIINIYCIICVLSYYQGYGDEPNLLQIEPNIMIPLVEYQVENCCVTCVAVIENEPKLAPSKTSNLLINSDSSSGWENGENKAKETNGLDHKVSMKQLF